MRLLFLTHCYPINRSDNRGIFFLEWISCLREQNIEVDIITPSWDKEKKENFAPSFYGENLLRFSWGGAKPGNLSLRNPITWISLLGFLLKWRREIKHQQKECGDWDAVVIAWALPAGLLLCLGKLFSCPTVIWWLGTDYNRFNKGFGKHLLRYVALKASQNWANSKRMVKNLKSSFAIAAKFVPLINLSHGKGESFFGPRNKKQIILTIGRLEKVKGIDVGILAVKKLLAVNCNIEYRIIGSGQQRDYLSKLSAEYLDNIILLGNVDEKMLVKELHLADFVLIPSRTEGMPLVFFEALLAQKPIIATDVGDLAICLKNTALGLISPVGDVLGLSDNIEKALNGQICFEKRQADDILQNYSIDITVKNTLNLFQ